MGAQPKAAKATMVENRVESFVSYGRPHCDKCYSQAPEDRVDDSEFWPDEVVHYIRGGCSDAVSFWGVSLCEYHDVEANRPEDATHRVVDSPEFIGDSHRMNSAYEHRVLQIKEL